MKQDYYWSTSKQFPARKGAPLEVGRWGRVFREDPIAYSSPFSYIDELVYENVRLRHYAGQISRLEAFFFFDNLDWAIDFAGDSLIYEVELLDPTAAIDRHIMADFGSELYLKNAEGFPATSVEEIEKNAHRYWSYAPRPDSVSELLTKGPVKVVKRIKPNRLGIGLRKKPSSRQ
jgi:hypothetical protein